MTCVEMVGITKCFSKVVANNAVDFSLEKGEIHALLGENGAGKTTLMRILYGLYQPDAGRILLNGKPCGIHSPAMAIQNGIGMIHQHFMLVPDFTIAENIATALPGKNFLNLDLPSVEKRIRALSAEYGMPLDPKRKVEGLTVGEQQKVEIIKTLYRGVDVLIMDEPTAVLIPQEVEELFKILRGLTKGGTSVIIISHKLNEIMSISDRVTIMRNGVKTGTVRTCDTTQAELARMMVGREVVADYNKKPMRAGEAVLQVENLCYTAAGGRRVLDGLNLSVRKGEIVGIAGVDGNGQTQLAEAIAGLLGGYGGAIRLDGEEISRCTPRQRCDKGLGFVPEDRHATGLVLQMSTAYNLMLRSFYRAPFYRNGFLRRDRIARFAKGEVERYGIKAGELDAPVSQLSGGNQQKVTIARELALSPKMLVIAQPTRGLDVGAIEFVHKTLLAARDEGLGILLISSELDEILNLSDRVMVMYEGTFTGMFYPGELSIGEIGLLMSGRKESMR